MVINQDSDATWAAKQIYILSWPTSLNFFFSLRLDSTCFGHPWRLIVFCCSCCCCCCFGDRRSQPTKQHNDATSPVMRPNRERQKKKRIPTRVCADPKDQREARITQVSWFMAQRWKVSPLSNLLLLLLSRVSSSKKNLRWAQFALQFRPHGKVWMRWDFGVSGGARIRQINCAKGRKFEWDSRI